MNENEKLMIFTTGSRTYQPHQIGIKLMSKVKFRTKLNIPENIFEAAEEARRKREEERASRLDRINFEPTPWSDFFLSNNFIQKKVRLPTSFISLFFIF